LIHLGVVTVRMTGEIVVVDGARTPHGTLLGSLSDLGPVELGRTALDGLLERTDLGSDDVDWVALGNAIQAGIGQVPGRQVVVESNLSNETPATTVNEASGSGLRAIALAADRIAAGRADLVVAGGFESMSNAPWILPDYRTGRRYGDVTLKDSMLYDSLWDVSLDVHMGEITEGLVEREGISREAQDEYALESHQRAADAIDSGRFDDEIVPVDVGGETVETDEGPRPDSTLSDLGSLPTPFREDGTITPGNASKLSDGAGVALLADAEAATDRGFEPMAELVDYAVVYRDPDRFNEAVGDVVAALLDRTGLEVDDVDAFWLNEAFAAQSVAVMDRHDIPREKLNPLGGAVAFGHPIGASGGMLATSLAYQLRDDPDVERGVVGMSIGGGGAIVALFEAVA
jgi:acetyl-CoA C-acetyltransferase